MNVSQASGHTTTFLHNLEQGLNENLEAITCMVIGVFITLGGFFLLLAALNVLPPDINGISRLGTSQIVVAAAGMALGLGLLLAGCGIYTCSRDTESLLPSPSGLDSRVPIVAQSVDEKAQLDFVPSKKETPTTTPEPSEILEIDPPLTALSPEMVHYICMFLDSKTASILASVSKGWNFHVNDFYKAAVDQLISNSYNYNFPCPRYDIEKKRYSSLNYLGLTLEHNLYKKHAWNDLYSFYHVETIAMINCWGTVRAIMTDNNVLNWCFVVDFHRPISLTSSSLPSSGITIHMSKWHSIFSSPFSLMGMYQQDSTQIMILSSRMIALRIDVIKNFLWNCASDIDDPRVKELDKKMKLDHMEKTSLYNKYESFTEADHLKFTLEMVKNVGKKILAQGVYLWGDDPYGEFSLQEIVENYKSRRWQVTYLNGY